MAYSAEGVLEKAHLWPQVPHHVEFQEGRECQSHFLHLLVGVTPVLYKVLPSAQPLDRCRIFVRRIMRTIVVPVEVLEHVV